MLPWGLCRSLLNFFCISWCKIFNITKHHNYIKNISLVESDMKKLFTAVVVILSFLIVAGCSATEESTSNINEDEDSYELHTSYHKHVESQYSVYYFTPSEARDIIVLGWFPQSEENTFTSIYCSGSGISSQTSFISNGPNKYKNIAGLGYEFVVPVEITAPSTIVEYTVSINGFGVSNTFTLKVGADRMYEPEYRHMINCDYLTLGTDFTERLNTAFTECGTQIYLLSQGVPFTQAEIYVSPLTQLGPAVYVYLLERNLPSAPELNKVYFYGLSTFDAQGRFDDVYGSTIRVQEISGDPVPLHCNSFVFAQKVINEILFPNDYITLAGIHELGHARGMELLSNFGYEFERDITNGDHTGGHNGKNKELCLIRYVFEADPNYQDFVTNPLFCKSHEQMLYNAEW